MNCGEDTHSGHCRNQPWQGEEPSEVTGHAKSGKERIDRSGIPDCEQESRGKSKRQQCGQRSSPAGRSLQPRCRTWGATTISADQRAERPADHAGQENEPDKPRTCEYGNARGLLKTPCNRIDAPTDMGIGHEGKRRKLRHALRVQLLTRIVIKPTHQITKTKKGSSRV